MGVFQPPSACERIKLADEPDFKLGGMIIKPAERLVIVNGEHRELQPRVMQVLVALARGRPHVISRERLQNLCWEGRIVSDAALNRCVLALRHLAHGFTPEPFEIETVPRIGHRLVERGAKAPALEAGNPTLWRMPATATLAVLAMLAAAAAFLFRAERWPWETGEYVPTVLVTSDVTDTASRELARDLVAKLGSLQAAQSPKMRLIGSAAESSGKPDLVLSVRRATQPAIISGSVVLSVGRSHSILWSKEFDEPSRNVGDLKQQIAYTTAQVVDCALEGIASGDSLSDVLLKNYLTACAALSDYGDYDRRAIVQMLEGVVRSSPSFVAGWAKLLQAEVEAAESFTHPEGTALKPNLKRHIVAARRIEPDLAEAYIAESMFIPWANYIERGRLLDKAVARNPSHALARSFRSQFFSSVGRMDEAVREAREAVRLDPLSPALRDTYVAALAYDGAVDAALDEVAKAERLWPGASSVAEARYRVHLRYGDPKEALRLIRSRTIDAPIVPVQQTFLEARLNPSPENVQKTIRQVRNLHPQAIGAYVQTLAEFGRKEELLKLLSSAPVEALAAEDAYFRPAFRELHRDPRFMPVTKRIGLLNYWRTTGAWPDFCYVADLPYSCKEEAAKASGRPVQ